MQIEIGENLASLMKRIFELQQAKIKELEIKFSKLSGGNALPVSVYDGEIKI